MKISEIVWELSKCNTETQSEQMLLKNSTDGFAQDRIATSLHFIKKKKKKGVSAKYNKAKYNKMRCLYI